MGRPMIQTQWQSYAALQCCLVALLCFVVGFFPLYSVYEPGGLGTSLELHCYLTYATLDTCEDVQGWDACYQGLHNKGGEDCTNFFLQLGSVGSYNTVCMICYGIMLVGIFLTTMAVIFADSRFWWFAVDYTQVHQLVAFTHFICSMAGALVLHETTNIITEMRYNTGNSVGSQAPEVGLASIALILAPLCLLCSDLLYIH